MMIAAARACAVMGFSRVIERLRSALAKSTPALFFMLKGAAIPMCSIGRVGVECYICLRL
jgi:hypothetical protein